MRYKLFIKRWNTNDWESFKETFDILSQQERTELFLDFILAQLRMSKINKKQRTVHVGEEHVGGGNTQCEWECLKKLHLFKIQLHQSWAQMEGLCIALQRHLPVHTHCSLFLIARHGKNLEAHQQMNLKENVVHLYNGTLHNSVDKKHDIVEFSDKWTELETINLHEVTETQKDKYHCFLLNGFFFFFASFRVPRDGAGGLRRKGI